ncbi:MAG: SIMPL domain-containing protein [Acidimicrobiales bacterium]
MSEQPADVERETGKGPRSWARVSVVTALAGAVVVAGVGFGGVEIGRSSNEPPAHHVLLDAARSSVAPNGTITVTGSGTVQGTPDTVTFQIGVHTQDATATAALSDNNSRVVALEATLAKHGATAKDMQTSGLNIYENTYKGAVTGFSFDDDLNVSMHGISGAGSAIDAAALAVGNGIQLYGISFSISNQSGLLAAARSRAMHDAAIEAAQVAAGANATLGGIVRVTDQENSNPGVFANVGGFVDAASVPLQAGRQPVSVQVTVVYALRP